MPRADVYASFEFHDERAVRCFPWRALKWEDDAGGSLPAPEAFGQERRQRRELFFRVLRKRDLRRKADTTAESFHDRAVKCASALNAHASPEFHDKYIAMRCFPWRASKWEDDAAGSMPAPEAFGRERRQCRELFLPCTAEEKFAAQSRHHGRVFSR